jgi:hypothetical protein
MAYTAVGLAMRCDVSLNEAEYMALNHPAEFELWADEHHTIQDLKDLLPDEWTYSHFDKWLRRARVDEEWHATRKKVVRALLDDPTLMQTHSWPDMERYGSE